MSEFKVTLSYLAALAVGTIVGGYLGLDEILAVALSVLVCIVGSFWIVILS